MMTPLRVLFVEDSETDVELIRFELRRGGYEVEFQRVETKEDFLLSLADRTWDLIISDFSMPHFDGLRAFKEFNKLGLDIPFIFVSGAMGEERAVQAMKAGARDYILKGQLGRLNAAVQRELDEAMSRSKRREAEAAKAREQSRLAVALQATGAGVFEYRTPPVPGPYCNERFAEIFGVEPGDLPPAEGLFEWILDTVHTVDRANVSKCHRDYLAGKTSEYAFDCRISHGDTGWREVSCRADAAQRDADGRVTDLVGVILDRTQERRMEEQFRQAQKMEAIGQLAGGIAHDFNNLLTVISNFGEFVLERLEPDTEVYSDMQEVLKAASRAETLTSQLLAYSRRRPVALTTLNVNELVQEMDKMLRRLLGDTIEVRLELGPDLWNVRIDAGGFEQVIMNLAVNARDAMSNGGRLCIETSNAEVGADHTFTKGIEVPPGEYVLISVTDTGVGMDAETQARLFEPFFTTKEQGKGTGLGLATCYGIVKQARGFIWVYSERGHGTSFKIMLPSTSEPTDPAVETTHSEKLRGTETLLVVEDDGAVRNLVVRMLSMLGYNVLQATDASDALSVAEQNQTTIHAVITDVVMPKTQGPELVQKLSAAYPGIKVIYMSGFTRDAIEMDETIVLVQKPFSPKILATKVRDVLDRKPS